MQRFVFFKNILHVFIVMKYNFYHVYEFKVKKRIFKRENVEKFCQLFNLVAMLIKELVGVNDLCVL